ncbi:hypothetical protein AKO1_001754 [Acrasis kona]|uniref:RNase III domain-containing protein n=1 Tax=Acrasis kona TaxID=1008807 RepID=A0AAW2ZA08_9EUKA
MNTGLFDDNDESLLFIYEARLGEECARELRDVFGVCDLSTQEIKKLLLLPQQKAWAWHGDAYFTYVISDILFEKNLELEQLNNLRERYKTNKVMAEFVKQMTPNLYKLIKSTSIQEYNNHSLGTCFEALLFLSYKKNDFKSREVIRKIMQVIDTQVKPTANGDSLENIAIRVDFMSTQHSGVLKEFFWTSRKRITRTGKYYDCCGADEADKKCKLVNYLYHPGIFTCPRGSRRSGGCSNSFGQPILFWSCCGRMPREGGCSLRGQDPTIRIAHS